MATRQDIDAAEVARQRAAVAAGAEYDCRPDRVGMAIVVCVLVLIMFVPTTLMGLSVNPALGGYVFLACATGLPIAGIAGLLMVRRNSCFFVTRDTVGRRDWRGVVVASIPRGRAKSIEVSTPSGHWESVLDMHASDQSGLTVLPTSLYWWSDKRIREFVAVSRP